MAYASLISLENTINRILNHTMVSISLEDKQQIICLREYVITFTTFLDKFPDKFNSLGGRMRDVTNKAEDILEYLVLEKLKKVRVSAYDGDYLVLENLKEVFVYSDDESGCDPSGDESGCDPSGDESGCHPTGDESGCDPSGDESGCDPTGDESGCDPTGVESGCDPSGDESGCDPTGDESGCEPTGVESGCEPTGNEFRCDPSGDESGCDPSEGDRRKRELELLFEKVEEDIYLIAGEVKVLEKVMEEIDLLAREVNKIKNSSRSKGVDSPALTSSSTAHATVGFEDYLKEIKDRLCGGPSKLQVIPICGMGGIGKTTLARKVYEDPLIREQFVIRVWVTVSKDYSVYTILSSLRESLTEFETGISESTDKDEVYRILMLRKYLIVMDDMWSSEAWDAVKRVFPDSGNGSRIVLTTRLSDVAYYPDPSTKLCEMQLMDADQSWSLLKQKIFEGKDYPELENIGKEIASGCKGLPLAIVVIAGLLSTVSKNPNSWKEIANKFKSIKTTEQEQIEEILSLSYTHLPQYLRPCFLHMGSFPEDQEINATRLVRLWVAEGFVKRPNRCQSLEDEAEECLNDLVKRNLVLATKRKYDGRVKSCSLHDVMRDLSIRKAHESKFLLSFLDGNVEKEHFLEKVKNERRISVNPSNLAHLLSFDGSAMRSIMCSREESLSLDDTIMDFVRGVRLLRVLDAEPVLVNSLHPQLSYLFHLRYLAIGYAIDFPLSWLNLQNLQTLIIHSEYRFDFVMHWCMPQLRHVYSNGLIYFVDPEAVDSPLENLETLYYVSHSNCTERKLKMIPCLKKLKIDCTVGDATHLNDLIHLHQLESLEIEGSCWLDTWPENYKFSIPMMLKKLCLKALELNWDSMAIVGSLQNLRVLKLLYPRLESSTWETSEGQFPRLEFLVMESWNLENWITESSHFPRLRCLVIDCCSDLNKIPSDIGEIPTLELIEIKSFAKKSLVISAYNIKEEQEDMGNNALQFVFKHHVYEYDM